MIDFNAMLKLVDLNTILASLCWITAGIFTLAQKYAPQGKKPWNILLSFIGREINADIIQAQKETSERIDALDKKLESIQQDMSDRIDALDEKIVTTDKKLDKNVAISARVRILRFGDELQEEKKPSKGRFDQALADINEYEEYCVKHSDFKNGITEPTSGFIKEQYQERLRKHDFSR